MDRLKVAIVGAGNYADYHVRFAKAYAAARIVGIADIDLDRAERYVRACGAERAYSSVTEMLSEARPDVVHVVTPPSTHVAVAKQAIEAGSHVLVETPLALNYGDAQALYELADRHTVRLCAIHQHLFDPCMREAHALVTSGRLGRIVNVESYYGLDTNIPAFRDYPRPNVLPWLYSLPGGVYQDFLPHPLYLLLEYIGFPRSLTVKHRSTGVLAQRLPDEIRILLDGEDAMGIVTLSFSARPPLHFLRIYGTGGMVEVDFAQQKVRRTFANVFQLRSGRLKSCHGMMTLIHAFYDSIRLGGPTPVSRERALDVVATMDMVFEQLKYEPLRHEKLVPVLATAPTRPRVLVTGGTGFLGRALVRRLMAAGYAVRVLVRKLANADAVHGMGAEVVWGDIADMESFGAAMNGCDLVVHLAAGTSGSDKDSQTATLQGTRNLLELCRRYAPTRLVYISSCSVYAVADYKTGASVVETSSLERLPEQRGRYAASKLEAERYVREFIASSGVPTVILRPGAIYGPGGDLYTGMMGFSVGSQYIVIGKGDFVLPVVYVENLVDAIMLSLQKDEAAGQIFNVVDTEKLDKRTYMNRVIRRVDSKARVLYFPYWLLYSLTWMQERALRVMKRRPVLSCYRLVSSQRSVLYDSRRIVERLGWRPGVNVSEAIDRLVDSELARQRKVDGSVQGVPSNLLQSVVAHGPSAVDSAQ